MQNAVPMRAQLGDFELDLKAGELLKNGGTVRLQEQPFQILLMLAERSGELVSRAEIKEKLWPNGVVVEFEHSISTAIKSYARRSRTAQKNQSMSKPWRDADIDLSFR